MKERPILFNGEMVRAVMDGRKTQTRRVIKPQPWNEADRTAGGCGFAWGRKGYDSRALYWNTTEQSLAGSMIGECPYGQPGDRLWVRETWACSHLYDQFPPRLIPLDARFAYAATEHIGGLIKRPSIHMPQWASRILLEIESVRVERLNAITADDCRAEGTEDDKNDGLVRLRFSQLWTGINEKRGFAWHVNPWVWAITFRRVK